MYRNALGAHADTNHESHPSSCTGEPCLVPTAPLATKPHLNITRYDPGSCLALRTFLRIPVPSPPLKVWRVSCVFKGLGVTLAALGSSGIVACIATRPPPPPDRWRTAIRNPAYIQVYGLNSGGEGACHRGSVSAAIQYAPKAPPRITPRDSSYFALRPPRHPKLQCARGLRPPIAQPRGRVRRYSVR